MISQRLQLDSEPSCYTLGEDGGEYAEEGAALHGEVGDNDADEYLVHAPDAKISHIVKGLGGAEPSMHEDDFSDGGSGAAGSGC